MLTTSFVDAALSIPGSQYETRICCPECDDTSFHMYINRFKGVYHCFKCGAKGKIVDTNEVDISKYYKQLIALEKKKDGFKDLPKRTLPVRQRVRSQTLSYLVYRGINQSDIDRYDIFESEIYKKKCIVFPIYEGNQVKYWVARKLEGGYFNAPWKKENTLYIVGPRRDYSIIVEGVFDAIAVAKLGYNAKALLGKQATVEQLERLIRESKYGYLVFLDSDAFKYAVELALQLRAMTDSLGVMNFTVKLFHSTTYKDPSSMPKENLEKLLHDYTLQFKYSQS